MSDDNPKFHVKPSPVVSRETSTTRLQKCPVCGHQGFLPYLDVVDHSISRETFTLENCGGCGFICTNPRPVELDPYYDSEVYISHSKTKKGLINRLYHLGQSYNLWSKFRTAHRWNSGQKWLDYGCGAGDFLSYAHKRGMEIEGVEPHHPSRESLQAIGHTVHTPEEYALLSCAYDCITMWHVLEHVPNLREVLGAHHRRLNPAGILIVAVPNPHSYDAKTYQSYWAAYDVPRHLWHFTQQDIAQLAAQTGFELVGKKGMLLDALYISMLSAKYQKTSMARGVIVGLLSNLKAAFKQTPFSSQIYILRKKHD